MKAFVRIGIVTAVLLAIQFLPASSQIPAACSDASSLDISICCPDTEGISLLEANSMKSVMKV